MLDRRPIKSPCISVCVMDPGTGWCEGCFRTIAEIGAWARMSHDDRDRVMADLPARRKLFKAREAAQ
ncbi:DUF1289 domain-containing protein [Hansschlegelia quercus]|uniref:DUF1289 domain-containing protein n=1 Tax=Hansschlegelia quercus TaxID=2528245 RepID=A0A4Q9GC26_9HYPH|nr:DUF1289 domain-containing protein [Hansschlegelia quercus]TBN48756.1 DUF1289 domain-containing protein [Hansschlegelia quercus]